MHMHTIPQNIGNLVTSVKIQCFRMPATLVLHVFKASLLASKNTITHRDRVTIHVKEP